MEASAELLRSGRDGEFELIVSEQPFAEPDRAFADPKLGKRIPTEEASALISWLPDHGTVAQDPGGPPPVTSPDPDDDHLPVLANSRRAFLVTRDQHLLGLRDELPNHPPAAFLRKLRQHG